MAVYVRNFTTYLAGFIVNLGQRRKESLNCKGEVGVLSSSLPLNFGTIGFTCLLDHGRGQSEYQKFLLSTQDLSPGRPGGDTLPYPSAMACISYCLTN